MRVEQSPSVGDNPQRRQKHHQLPTSKRCKLGGRQRASELVSTQTMIERPPGSLTNMADLPAN